MYNCLKKNNGQLRTFINDTKNGNPCSENFWKRKYDIDIINHYKIAHNTTPETRLRLLHFKILHNIYPTNIMLQKMKIKESVLCETCNVTDYIEHFFVECKALKNFWAFVCNKILIHIEILIKLSNQNILFGVTQTDLNKTNKNQLRFVNYMILLGKMCISKFKYGKIKNLCFIFEHEFQLRLHQITWIKLQNIS